MIISYLFFLVVNDLKGTEGFFKKEWIIFHVNEVENC